MILKQRKQAITSVVVFMCFTVWVLLLPFAKAMVGPYMLGHGQCMAALFVSGIMGPLQPNQSKHAHQHGQAGHEEERGSGHHDEKQERQARFPNKFGNLRYISTRTRV